MKAGFQIGFVGYKNAGKTHISSKLQALSPAYNAIGFSDPLYACLEAATGITIDRIQDKESRELPDPRLGGRSIQYALNTLGSDWGRKMMFEEIWVNRAFSRSEYGKLNLFDNVRFLNEFEGVRKGSGSVIFGIWNDDVKDDGSYPETLVNVLQRKADFIIDNTGQQFANNPDLILELHTAISHTAMCSGLEMTAEECFPSVSLITPAAKFFANKG